MPMNVLVDAINQNFRQIEDESRRKVFTDEDGNDTIIIGREEDGNYNIKVAAKGYNANTASDDQLVMSSKWNMWKIIASGVKYMNPATTRRSGNLSLTSTYIGYVGDIFIPIKNIPTPASSSLTQRIQVFVRDWSTKADLNKSGTLYNDGTNRAEVVYSYFILYQYLVIRTTVVWVAGTVTFTPQSHALTNVYPYWEIANPTRAVPPGMGGAGAATGKYCYYDSIVYNPNTTAIEGYDQSSNHVSIAADSFSSIYSYTYRFYDNATSYKFPFDSFVPPIPAVAIS